MKISIIVAVYNVEKYISKCFDSIINQTLKDFEVIVIDDGSTDGTGNIINAFQLKDHRIKGIHQSNQGVASARNHAISMASGEWICFVDGDDFIHPDYLKICSQTIKKHNDVNIFLFDHIQSKTIQFASLTEITEQRIDISLRIPDKIWKKGVWDAIYRKSSLVDINFLDSPLGEDLDFIRQCLLRNDQVVNIDVPLYAYREREGSAVHTAISFKKTLGSLQCSVNTLQQLLNCKKVISPRCSSLLFRTVFETPAYRCMSLANNLERQNIYQEWIRLTEGFLKQDLPSWYTLRIKFVHYVNSYHFWILLMGWSLSIRITLCKMRDSFRS